MRGPKRSTAACALLALAAVAVPACSRPQANEIVISATRSTSASHGTFEMMLRVDFSSLGSQEGDQAEYEGNTPYEVTFDGAWDGSTSWIDASQAMEAFGTEGDSLEDSSEDRIDAEPVGYLMSDGVGVEEWEVDGERRWFESETWDPESEEESLDFTSMDPAMLLDDIRSAAKDPDSVQEVDGGEFVVPLSFESIAWTFPSSLTGDPEGYEGYEDDPEGVAERLERIEKWHEEHAKHHATLGIDDQGRLERATIEFGLRGDEYLDCEPLHWARAEFRMTISYTYTEEPPELPDPAPEEIEDSDALDDLRFAEFEDGSDDATESEATEDDMTDLPDDEFEDPTDTTLQTVAGERNYVEVLLALRAWAEEAGIDWTAVPIPEQEQMVELFNTWFTQHAEAEGGALQTADDLWLPSDVRQVLVAQGGTDPGEVDSLSREDLVARFDELFAESGGRGSLDPNIASESADSEDEGYDEYDDYVDEYLTSLDGCPA